MAQIVRRMALSVGVGAALIVPYAIGAFPPLISFKKYLAICLFLSAIHSVLPLKVRQNVLLATASAMIMLGIVDLIARTPMVSPHLVYGRWPALPILYRWPANVDRQYSKQGLLSDYLRDARYREVSDRSVVLDAYGYRNNESDPAGIEIITLGDSFTVGAVNQEQSWPAVLGQQMDQQVYNLGVVATSPYQQYVTLAIEEPRLQTTNDAVVIWMLYTGNDLDDAYGSEWEIDQLDWNGPIGQAEVAYSNFRRASRIGIALSGLSFKTWEQVLVDHLPNGEPILFFEPAIKNAEFSEEQVREHPNFDGFARTVDEAKRLTNEKGLQLYMVIAPSKEEVYRWVWDDEHTASDDVPISNISAVMAGVAQEAGVCVLELAPLFEAEARRVYQEDGEQLYWRDDTHWNIRGNQFAAEQIGERLRGIGNQGCP